MIVAALLAWAIATAAPASPASPASPAAAHDAAADEARVLYVEAKTAYDGGRFNDALQGFQAAFAKKPLPGFLFNLGQCERQLGHPERALFFFERYLDEKPDAANRATVEELIADVRVQIARAAPPPPPTTTSPSIAAGTTTSAVTTDGDVDDGVGVWPVVAGTAVAVVVGVAVGVGVALVVTSSQATLGTHQVTP